MQIEFIRIVDALFADAPQTLETLEMKEEIVQNLMHRYRALLAEGKTEQEAFAIASAALGDMDDILQTPDLHAPEPRAPFGAAPDPARAYTAQAQPQPTDWQQPTREQLRHQAAMSTAFAVMLYILCPLPVIIFENMLGVLLLFAMIAIATGMLIYNHMTRDAYAVRDAVNIAARRKRRHRIGEGLTAVFWLMVVAFYFVVSFESGAWHLTWIIFLFASAVQVVLGLVFKLDD
ncbi:MAG: permease prefix domain 1-containing protein [Oscillospiraceae bacterium]|jgi:hypothetical protein|nr:permease prefix domain 1-containing protein [Oscillospiraceae bacterium]